MNDLASAIANIAPGVDTTYYRATLMRMLCNPWRVKAAILGVDQCDWSHGTESLDELEAAANDRLETGLTALERLDTEAALEALDDFRQQRSCAEDNTTRFRMPTYR